MMRLLILLMACTISIGHFSFAQEPVYKWGEPVTNENTDREIDQLLSLGDDGFVLLRTKAAMTTVITYWLEFYNAELQSTGVQEVEFSTGVMGDSYFLDEIKVANGKIYAFVSHWSKAAGEHTLAIKELTMEGELVDIKDLTAIDALKMGNRGQFSTSFSDDGSKLLVLSELPFVKKTKEKVRLTCFDVASMEQIWQHDEELVWDNKRAANNYAAVDNAGGAYMFKRIWQKPEWRYSLYTVDGSGNWKSHSDIQLQGKQVEDYEMRFNKNNEFYMFATYTLEPSNFNRYLHGYWFAHFKTVADKPTISSTVWPEDILRAYTKKKEYIPDFHVEDILVRKDGNLLVLMEQMKKSKDVIVGSSPIKYTYQWNYGSFMSLCLDPASGETIWWQKFDKKQEVKSSLSSLDYYGSFVYHLKDDRLYVLWNNTPLSVPSIPPASWTEADGTKYVKHKAFDEKTKHATFMRVIEPDGSLAYANRKFGLPLFGLHAGAVFEMSLTTPFFFEVNGTLVVMSTMHNGGKRYRFGFVAL